MQSNTIRQADEAPVAQASQYATFVVDKLFFGLDVLSVQEVLREQPMTEVPLAPAEVEGLINLRGQIVTALDMRRRLGLPPRPKDQPAMNIVIQTPGGPVSLVVDAIGDVVQTGSARMEAPPENLAPATRELIRGIFNLDKRLLLILRPERTIELPQSCGPHRSPDNGHPNGNTLRDNHLDAGSVRSH